jgi:hypothetical protein
MAISQVQICNMALAFVGATPIEAMGERTKEASQCRLWYDVCREQTLSAFNWGFARKRRTLACHGDDPPDQWAYRYQYPVDCLKARWIVNPFDSTGIGAPFIIGSDIGTYWPNASDAIPFEVEMAPNGTKSILTNEQCPELVYTFNQDEPGFFSQHFVDCLAVNMASRMAFTITGKRSIANDAAEQYVFLVRNAAALDANESVSKPPRDAEWIRGRN